MGIQIIKMPDIGEGIAEVELVAWHVKVGDVVAEDQILADVMTDKATVEIPSHVAGTVVSLGGAVGQVMAVGSEVIRIETADMAGQQAPTSQAESPPDNQPPPQPSPRGGGSQTTSIEPQVAGSQTTSIEPQEAAKQEASIGPHRGESPARNQSAIADRDAAGAAMPAQGDAARPLPRPPLGEGGDGGLPASTQAPELHPMTLTATVVQATAARGAQGCLAAPAVRKRAQTLGMALHGIQGSGQEGRITHADLDAQLAARALEAAPNAASSIAGSADLTGVQAIPVIGLRRKIAQKMQESKRHIPHFTYVEEVDVTELENLRAQLNAEHGQTRGRLTLLPFLIRAMVLAVRNHPEVNARYDDTAALVTRYSAVHLGLATQTEGGLMVPVIRDAQNLDLWACAAAVQRLAEAARSGRASRDELTGSTITLTSLGALGGIVSTPVINHPEVAIVGTNRIVERPVMLGGAVVARKMMNLSSSFDHRVVDGMNAAQFIQQVRRMLECPGLLFVP